jgi:hypothetical protein
LSNYRITLIESEAVEKRSHPRAHNSSETGTRAGLGQGRRNRADAAVQPGRAPARPAR